MAEPVSNNWQYIFKRSVTVGALMLGSGAVQAQYPQQQTGVDGDFMLEEIIVTAAKRPQTLQETPVAVSVTDAGTIEKARVVDISDLQTLVPSLRVLTFQTTANTNFLIRGFGNGANNAGIEPSVGVFIDGVYRSRSAASIDDLPRLERIEVLRGPQSTLFGKNASAGVISVITAPPSYEPEGRVEAQYGNYNQRLLRGFVTGGLSDSFAVSFSGGLNKRNGYIETLDPAIPDINSRDRWHVRGQALWQPSADISLRLIADHSEIDDLCCGVTNILNGPTAAIISGPLQSTILDTADPFAYLSPVTFRPINDIEDGGISLQGDFEFSGFTLTSISSWRSNNSFNDSEADYTGAEIVNSANNHAMIDTYTQEIRLTSTGDNKVDWIVGGFLFSEDITQIQGVRYGADIRTYADLLTGTPGTLLQLERLSGSRSGAFFSADTTTVETFTQDNRAWSAFATVDLHISDRLTLTAGLNQTEDKKRVTGSTLNNDLFGNVDFNVAFFNVAFLQQTGLPPTPENIAAIEAAMPGTQAAIMAGADEQAAPLRPLQFLPQFLAFPNSVEDGRSNDSKLTWTARLAYQVNSNLNLYFSASTGYKATSWNLSRDSRPFFADADALQAAGLLPNNYFPGTSLATSRNFGTRFAAPEEAMVYELGLKARFPRAAFNLAIFDQRINGFQSNIFLGTGFVLGNAGKQSTKGVEVDATWTPIDALTLTFAGTYLDPVYDDFRNAPGPNGTVIDASGNRPAGIHEFSITTSVTYNHEFDSGVYGFIRADVIHESDVQVVDNISAVNREVNQFNASAGIENENGLGISVWGRNLFNDEYFVSTFPGVVQTGTVNGFANTPRLWGISLSYEF